jgi:hypothetical protein
MNEPDDKDRALERLLDRALSELPARRAPPTLESRVLGELERRAALPWWRHSFAHWPRAARTLFVLTCCGLGGLAFVAGAWTVVGVQSLHEAGALSMPWAHRAMTIVGVAGELASMLAEAVPPTWLYDGLAVSAALYAALFGLGVAAYRTLYLGAAETDGIRS